MTEATPQTEPSATKGGRAYWEFHFEQLEHSRLNRKAYCRKHNISYGRFGYWYERFNKDAKKSKPTQLIPIQVTQTVDKPASSLPSPLLCRYDTKQGHQLHIYDVKAFKSLLERIT